MVLFGGSLTFLLLLVVSASCVSASSSQKLLDQQEWEQLEHLLQKVDQTGDHVNLHNHDQENEILPEDDDPDDESTMLFGAHQSDSRENTAATTEEPAFSSSSKKNPCQNHLCGWGKECLLVKNRPVCECVKRCPDTPNFDANDRVCSSQNHTFESICHLYQERCLCKKDDIRCMDPAHKHLHLEYLGACRELQPCTQEHMAQFSERMADWLFQVMKDLKKRQELHGDRWIHMIEDAEHDDHLKHVYPVIWKYCDLDRKPHDKSVTQQELIPIIAPVMPMESCIKPFLRTCDQDKNELISLKEWGMCLGLGEEEITERC